ncbi:MAG: hypothetical protein PHH77_10160 [Victivallaceae bacterium]|nr:hypothetical protein [Victivallaceae bacterium]
MIRKSGKRKKRTKNKFLKIILGTSVFFVLVLLAVLAALLQLVFDPAASYTAEPLTAEDVFLQTEVVKRLTALLVRSKPDEIRVLTLSPAEVNALITVISNCESVGDFLLSPGQIGRTPEKRPYKITFEKDYFDIKYSLPTEFRTPFGKHINLHLTGRPGIAQKRFRLAVKSAAAGEVALPPRQVELLLYLLLNSYDKDEIVRRIHDIVVKAHITPEHNLVIYFYPYRLRNCLTEAW